MKNAQALLYNKINGKIEIVEKEKVCQLLNSYKLKDSMTYKDIAKLCNFYATAKGVYNYKIENDIHLVFLIDKTLEDFKSLLVKNNLPVFEDSLEIIEVLPEMYVKFGKNYGGSSDNKQVKYNNKYYMTKFSKTRKNIINNNDLTIHRQASLTEFLSSKIIKLYGLEAQNVLMGYDTRKKELCVLCEDFTNRDEFRVVPLNEESSLTDEMQKDKRNTLNDLELYLKPKLLDRYAKYGLNKEEFIKFWVKLSVIDFLIGNRDRHLGNIGLLVKDEEIIKIAPVFDNGASLGSHIHVDDTFSDKSALSISVKYQKMYQNYNGIRVSYENVINKKLPKEFYEVAKELLKDINTAKGLEIFDKLYNKKILNNQERAHILLAKKIYLFNFKTLKKVIEEG